MGRASRSKGGAKQRQQGKSSGKLGKIQQQLDLAADCTARCDLEQALAHYEQALVLDPTHSPALDAAGEVLLELGQTDQARQVLARSVQINPTGNFASYMYLGQLSEGVEALTCYDRGIGLLTADLEACADPSEAAVLRSKLCESLSSKAELYMTDLCDQPEAQAECEGAIRLALEHGPSNVDALLTAASLCVCKQLRDEGLQYLDTAAEVLGSMEDDARPPPQVCLQAAKLYVELGEHEKAIEQLEEVLVDDDQLSEAHFMLAVELQHVGELDAARQAVTNAHKLHLKEPEPCPIIMQKILDLAGQLQE